MTIPVIGGPGSPQRILQAVRTFGGSDEIIQVFKELSSEQMTMVLGSLRKSHQSTIFWKTMLQELQTKVDTHEGPEEAIDIAKDFLQFHEEQLNT